MKIVVLSDHSQTQANAAAGKRQADFEWGRANYEAQRALLDLRKSSLAAKSKALWSEQRYFAWLFSFVPRLLDLFSVKPAPPVKEEAQRDEMVWNAGADGEQRVKDAMDRQLGDEWVAVSGYKNPGGEIDLLLVGPDGVLAIEIKFLNGEVSCEGDRWWRNKSDKYGNVVERNVPIADKGGRGPSEQVNAAASRLQRFLAERSPLEYVHCAVVLSHPLSSIGVLRSVTVDAVATLDSFHPRAILTKGFGERPKCSPDDLVRLITQDHHYHARRGKR
ncbi:MAG: nuclease-related domain-containing protein [Rhodoferax sp.]|nr:nuclease-related domain-containing protein [Rhodoferax sp.]